MSKNNHVATGIYKQGKNSYSIRVSTGKRGKHSYQYYTETFHGTVEEAKRRRAEILLEIKKGALKPFEKHLTLGVYIERWLEDLKQCVRLEKIRQSTARWYQETTMRYLRPLWHCQISQLTPGEIEELYADLLENLSPATVYGLHKALKAAFGDAKRLRVNIPDILQEIQAPTLIKPKRIVLTTEQAKKLLDIAKKSSLQTYAILLTLLTTGMRIGEVFALKWIDIDLDRLVITVSRTLIKAGKTPIFNPVKNAATLGPRLIKMTSILAQTLKEHRAEQEIRCQALGPLWHDFDLIFTTREGTPLDRRDFSQRVFKKLLREAELPDMRIHDLRHSVASILLDMGVPMPVVRDILGHTEIGTTVNIYGHPSLDVQEQAMKLLEKKLTS